MKPINIAGASIIRRTLGIGFALAIAFGSTASPASAETQTDWLFMKATTGSNGMNTGVFMPGLLPFSIHTVIDPACNQPGESNIGYQYRAQGSATGAVSGNAFDLEDGCLFSQRVTQAYFKVDPYASGVPDIVVNYTTVDDAFKTLQYGRFSVNYAEFSTNGPCGPHKGYASSNYKYLTVKIKFGC